MAKQIIALDIDGVLADWVGSAVPRLNKILKTNLNINDDVSFDLHTAFGTTRERMQAALDELYQNFSVGELKTVKGAQRSIRILSADYDFIAITARPKEFWSGTYKWVKANYSDLIELYFGTAQGKPFGGDKHKDDKLSLCEKFNVAYLIEDNPAEILAALETKTVPLCHAWPWNTEISLHPEIPRGNWQYLTKYLKNEKTGH
jgi:phosphoglycolate phosphatase-like HAD superfamily hydrolase